jgi:hypothetical protein
MKQDSQSQAEAEDLARRGLRGTERLRVAEDDERVHSCSVGSS